MRILIISDVHSNLEALQAVFAEVRGVDMVFNLGDLVGYGADPNGVIELIKSLDVELISILGNHDYAVISGDIEGMNVHAAQAALWTRRVLSEENKVFLKQLELNKKLNLKGLGFYLVHGSPRNPLIEYVYPTFSREILASYLRETQASVLLLGHTHIPMRSEFNDPPGTVLNPGSVGQSRDGIPNASCALINLEEGQTGFQHIRVNYEVEKPANKILNAGLPSILAYRLYLGL
ncbi:MAG: metallophosphoesterase family protein [Candidatus Bathyarchaeia archaeon]